MILFMQYAGRGQRGGDIYNEHLHEFIKSRFEDVIPREFEPRPAEFNSIVRHARHSLARIKEIKPDLMITDISSGARNVPAARWIKHNRGLLMLIIQERRMNFRYGNKAAVRWFVRACENYLIRKADIILTNSRFIAEYARRWAVHGTSIVVAHPGIQLTGNEQFESAEPKSAPDSNIDILSVGEWTEPRKGIKYLLEALPQLSNLNIHLNIAGSYDEHSAHYKVIKEIIERNKLASRITFHGYLERDRLSALYRQCRIFALPSLSEGYGMVLAEALSYGLPVVASNVAAIPEMIADGVNGLLVEPKRPDLLAAAIRKLIDDPELRSRMSQANLEKARQLPTWDDFDAVLERELVPVIERLTGLKARSHI